MNRPLVDVSLTGSVEERYLDDQGQEGDGRKALHITETKGGLGLGGKIKGFTTELRRLY